MPSKDETNAKISANNKSAWAKLSDEEKARRVQCMSKAAAEARRGKPRPMPDQVKAKIRATMRTDEFRERKSQEVAKYVEDHPEFREHLKRKAKERSDNEEFRNKMREVNLGSHHAPETVAKRTDTIRKKWDDPEFRKRQLERLRSPESRAYASMGGKKAMGKMTEEERRAWSLSGTLACQQMKGATSIERKSWAALDELGVTYETGQMLDRCLPDVLIRPNIVIECDGTYWHSRPENKDHDRKRDRFLRSKGYVVVRVSEEEINMDPLVAMEKAVEKARYIARVWAELGIPLPETEGVIV